MKVTGGQDDEAVGRPQIPHAAFEQALATSIRRFQIFLKVVGDQTEAEGFILLVTLLSIDEQLFGHTVRLEAGWTLRRPIQERLLGESRSRIQCAAGNRRRRKEQHNTGLEQSSKLNL